MELKKKKKKSKIVPCCRRGSWSSWWAPESVRCEARSCGAGDFRHFPSVGVDGDGHFVRQPDWLLMATGSQVTSKVPSCGPNSTWTSMGGSGTPLGSVRNRRADVLGFDRYAVDGVGWQARDGVPEDARLDGPHFDVIDADGVLVIGVGRQPRDESWRGRHVTHPDASRRRRHFLANDHSAGRVQRCPATQRHGPDTYPVRLQGQETNEDDSWRQFLL